jgi:hypothetical protein
MKNIFQKSNMKNSGVNARLHFMAMKKTSTHSLRARPTLAEVPLADLSFPVGRWKSSVGRFEFRQSHPICEGLEKVISGPRSERKSSWFTSRNRNGALTIAMITFIQFS